jgi:hypothetical protein
MDILKKIIEDWFNEFNKEIRRGKYPETRINVNWFDAVEDDGQGITGSAPKKSKGVGFNKERDVKEKSDISDIP